MFPRLRGAGKEVLLGARWVFTWRKSRVSAADSQGKKKHHTEVPF